MYQMFDMLYHIIHHLLSYVTCWFTIPTVPSGQLFSIATTIVGGGAGLSIETSAIATPSAGFTVGKSFLLLVGAGSWGLEFAVILCVCRCASKGQLNTAARQIGLNIGIWLLSIKSTVSLR